MRMWDEIRDQLAALPGVTSVGFASAAPLEARYSAFETSSLSTPRTRPPIGPGLNRTRTSPDCPGILQNDGHAAHRGRDFTGPDLYEKRHVAIVSENLAREWWHDPRAALGKRVRESSVAPWREVVGVVRTCTTTACT
jgi:hypothetical protein